jgi:general stress protein 26
MRSNDMDLPHSVATNVARVAELIRGVPTCMLTTVLGDGLPHARPMVAPDEPFDGSLWFLTEREGHLAHEIRRNPHVGVTFSDAAAGRHVSLSGTARLVEDRAVISRLWRAPMEAWFPLGPVDPAIALIRVDPVMAWFWEGPAGPGPGHQLGQLVELAKALVTGEGASPDPGTSGRLKL